ncbi:response regulator (plasmid) [Kovacikia minuta CCNUW1]|uniref:response regulator n=1 Tax=Kovacikia minuta TaxID=2931930 RepID=UPI001CCFC4FF|nr:response regulator [Kovacikia minuta]UBF29789.1 response regulator [Kovacikia minuta CCNUW1]
MLLTTEFLLNPRMLKDVQILLVDNDPDTRDLYTFLLEDHGAKVTASQSIQDALDFLDGYIPDILICELRFLGESVLPLIQRVRALAFGSSRPIPILVMSTCDPISLAEQLTVKVEAYLLKPVDISDFVDQVWNLAFLSNTVYPFSMQAWMLNQNPVKLLCCGPEVS